jgi:hypothetical protein
VPCPGLPGHVYRQKACPGLAGHGTALGFSEVRKWN